MPRCIDNESDPAKQEGSYPAKPFAGIRQWHLFLIGLCLTAGAIYARPPVVSEPIERNSGASARAEVPRRLVSLAPNITEIIADLGLAHKLVAVTRFCDFPPQVARLPKVGGLIDPDLERIIALNPDLVIMLKSASQRTEERLRGARLQVVSYRIETVSDLLSVYDHLGAKLGVLATARDRKKMIKAAFEPARGAQDSAKSPRPRPVFVISRQAGSLKQLLVAGSGTYFEDLARGANLGNLALGTKGYTTVSLEAILSARPDLVIEVVGDDDRSDPERRKREWERFFRDKSGYPVVIVLKGNHFLRPGPRLVRALQDLRLTTGRHSDNQGSVTRGKPA
ncbi:MAG: ABC transporter substrate-binding protein [bacterium JZ-2024 1]